MKVIAVILLLSCILPTLMANKLKKVDKAHTSSLEKSKPTCCAVLFNHSRKTLKTFCSDQADLGKWDKQAWEVWLGLECAIKVYDEKNFQGQSREFSNQRGFTLASQCKDEKSWWPFCSDWGGEVSSFQLIKL